LCWLIVVVGEKLLEFKGLLPTWRTHGANPVVEVMITIFLDFCRFFGKKWRFCQKTMLLSKFWKKLAVVWAKHDNIFAKNLAKIF
jgi:hypothetical protein